MLASVGKHILLFLSSFSLRLVVGTSMTGWAFLLVGVLGCLRLAHGLCRHCWILCLQIFGNVEVILIAIAGVCGEKVIVSSGKWFLQMKSYFRTLPKIAISYLSLSQHPWSAFSPPASFSWCWPPLFTSWSF